MQKEQRPSEVIYQIYPSSFADSNGDGHGDLRGITGKLDYIEKLGVDAIWISPFYPSPPGPDGDGGYAVSDYRAIDPRFGTMADFKDLLAQAHQRGLRVYIDFVPSHTANTHEWFEKSRDRVKPYDDYYVWHDGGYDDEGNRIPPNNWKSVFGGRAWRFDEKREQWYLHHFLDSQPALNLNRKETQTIILKEMKFWLDMGVDGFRLDALPFATHDTKFRNNPWLDGQWPRKFENWEDQYFEHSICQDETIDFISRIRELLDSYPDRKTALGEAIAGREGGKNSVPIAASYVNAEKGLDMCYTETLMSMYEYPGQERLKDMIQQIESHFADGGNCNASSNHDIPRAATRMTQNLPEQERDRALRQLMRLFMTLPGSYCMYQGEELGLTEARIPEDIPHDKLKDPVYWSRGPERGRDGCRTPMPWDSTKTNAGFSDSDDPYLPVPQAHYQKAVEQQEKDSGSMLRHVRALVAWRKKQPALIKGRTSVLDSPAPVLAFIRQSKEQNLLCLFNMSAQEQEIELASFVGEKLRRQFNLKAGEKLSLAPYGSTFVGDRPTQRSP